jgi:hypothetical protein
VVGIARVGHIDRGMLERYRPRRNTPRIGNLDLQALAATTACAEVLVTRPQVLINRFGRFDQSLQAHESFPSLLNATGEPDEFEADFHDVI